MNKDPAIAAATISHKTVHVMSDPGVKGEEMLLRTVSAYRIVTEISQNAKTTSIALFIIFAEIHGIDTSIRFRVHDTLHGTKKSLRFDRISVREGCARAVLC